jgi:[protein-PII] uridylyltransferase
VPVADVNTSRLGARLRQLLGGSTELRGRLAVGAASREAPPVVLVVPGASSTATVVEVRAQDRRGLVWAVCDVFARHRVDVRTAHLDTLGSQTYDVFYLVGPKGTLSLTPSLPRWWQTSSGSKAPGACRSAGRAARTGRLG